MLLLLLLAAAILVFSSCAGNPTRVLRVSLGPPHPWEEAAGVPMEWTLAVSTGEKIHLEAGRRETTVLVPEGKTVFVAAYPLGVFEPRGACAMPDDSSVTLTWRDGYLVGYFFDIMESWGEELSLLDWDLLMSRIEGDVRRVDRVALASDMLNGSLKEPVYRDPVDAEVGMLPAGRWIPESGEEEIWTTGGESVTRQLTDGLHAFWCPERETALVVFVDTQKKVVSRSMRRVARWW